MDTRRRQVRRGALAAAVIVIGVGSVAVIQGTGPPEYSSSVTFFMRSSGSGSDVSAAVASYAAALDGDALAATVIGELDLDLTVEGLRDEIAVTVEPNSVLLTATVTDSSAERALSIARAIAAVPVPVDAAAASGTELNVVEEPTVDPNPR